MQNKPQTEIPFFAIGNDELAHKKQIGTHVVCKHCSKNHEVEYGTSKKLLPGGGWSKPVKSNMGFYKCGDNRYLASIDGKEL